MTQLHHQAFPPLTKEKVLELRNLGENHDHLIRAVEAKELGLIRSIKDVPDL